MTSTNLNAKRSEETTKLKEFNIPLKLDEAQKAILELKESIDDEASTVLEQLAHFEDMAKKLDGVHFKKHIKLNVGGQIFKTSIETLLKDPDSMFASMFSERFAVQPDKEDGAYFIDRDGTHFRFILNYLRTGRLIFPRENKVLAAELLLEAEFYQIQGMAKEIWPGSTFQNSTYIVNSLTEDQRETLMSWLPTPVFTNWIQLFSSQVQGWSSANFHSPCNSKGPTVILARAGNFIFGGYAEVSWSSSGTFVRDENSFLFTLANQTGAPPTKLPQLADVGGIWGHSSYGPCFGSATGISLMFMNTTSSSICVANNSYGGFEFPAGQNFCSFICSSSVTMNYLEVFGLKDAC